MTEPIEVPAMWLMIGGFILYEDGPGNVCIPSCRCTNSGDGVHNGPYKPHVFLAVIDWEGYA